MIRRIPEEGLDLRGYLLELERDLIREALARTHGHKTNAAALLGMRVTSLDYRIQVLGISVKPKWSAVRSSRVRSGESPRKP